MEISNQFNLKYRPRKWEDVVGQDLAVKSLRKRILDNNYGKAILLEGPYGTGKTTLCNLYSASIMAHDSEGNPDWSNPQCKAILDETFNGDVIRLDGGMFSGKSDMVELLQDLNKKPLYSKDRVIIIEEADQLTGQSINALLKTLEDPKPFNHFILLSMLDKKGIPSAIKSRCQVYKINPVGIMPIMMGLKSILEKEGLWGSPKIPQEFFLEGLKTIAEASQGSMRSAVQYLEKCILSETWTVKDIQESLQVLDDTAIWKILDSLLDKTKEESILRQIMSFKTGDEVDHFYNYATMMLAEALMCKETKVAYSDDKFDRLWKMGNNPNCEKLYYCLTLHPQMTKGYIRTTDLLGCIVAYYQGMDFMTPYKGIPLISTTPSVVRTDISPDICLLREENTTKPNSISEVKVSLGSREEPKILKPTVDDKGIPVRQVPPRTRVPW